MRTLFVKRHTIPMSGVLALFFRFPGPLELTASSVRSCLVPASSGGCRLDVSSLGQRHGDDFPRTSSLFQGNGPTPSLRLLVLALACYHHSDICSRGVNLY